MFYGPANSSKRTLDAGIYTSYLASLRGGKTPGLPSNVGIGVGCTGPGLETWDEITKDLLWAKDATGFVGVYSLEGSVRQGLLEKFAGFDWSAPAPPLPVKDKIEIDLARAAFRAWLKKGCKTNPQTCHPPAAAGGGAGENR